MALVAGTAYGGSGQAFKPSSGAYGPYQDLTVSLPRVRLEIWAPDGREVTVSEMKIDEQVVSARYVKARRALEYVPTTPLGPGEHSVQCRVGFTGTPVYRTGWKFKILPNAVRDLPPIASEQIQMVEIVNRYRREMGLAECVGDPVLNWAALQHSGYCHRNGEFGHFQKAINPGFTGQTSFERLASLGWIGRSYEGVTRGETEAEEAIASLFDSPYHRLPFMQPGTVLFGSGRSGVETTVELGEGTETGLVVSPGDRQTRVRTEWAREETPNPLRLHKGAAIPTGYPVVVSLFGPDRFLTGVKAELSTGGKAVPFYLNSSANDPELKATAFIIPKKPLEPKTTYQVQISGQDEKGQAVEKSWSFTTAG